MLDVAEARVDEPATGADVAGELIEPLRCRHEPARAAEAEAPLGPGRGHGDGPALAFLAEYVFGAHAGVVEEQLGEPGLTVPSFSSCKSP